MPKLFSATHDLPELEGRLKRLLEPPADQPEPLAEPQVLAASEVRGWQRFAPMRILAAWREQGYAPLWLIERTPGLRDLYRLTRTLLTIQGHLQRVRDQIGEVEAGQQALRRQVDRLMQVQLDEGKARLDQASRLSRLEARDPGLASLPNVVSPIDVTSLSGLASPPATPLAPDARSYEDWYRAFEAEYRGAPEEILDRQRAYLPFIRQAIPQRAAALLVDLGCGGGDWLRLLAAEGYQAQGVDHNPAMIAAGRQAGLQIHQGDLLDYLRLAGDQSLDVLTAFQVVEHLPLDALLVLFREARRVLRPAGLLILETPNPENLQVSGYSFWLDPTHQRPLPPPLLLHLAGYFGFIDLRIFRLNPWPDHQAEAGPLDKLFYCEQDYALIARVPLAPAALPGTAQDE